MQDKKYINKIILVTGGSGGIGEEIVRKLSRDNYTVILNYNNSETRAKKIKEDLKKEGIFIDIVKADVTNKKEVKDMFNYIISKYNKIDVLINNAGIAKEEVFLDMTDEDWDCIINSNLNSVYNCTKIFLPEMLKRKFGLIINISSIWGVTGASCEVAYSTAKAAVNGFTKALAKEMGPSNIRINAIAPGFIDTKMNKDISNDEIEAIKNEIPLNRIGKADDIANCVKWLIEDSYTTGQIININGGWYI